ncbi:hypothetical protein E2C01_027081 [Portunus trituberculatus]|uniref:Uncharacterized protein n=1 Tax=Portunus trituberculatus TaxID=210409 RepID=A0A5B7EHV0_PORTR|nr:hypothetical protein [Portunus trituberculatus]
MSSHAGLTQVSSGNAGGTVGLTSRQTDTRLAQSEREVGHGSPVGSARALGGLPSRNRVSPAPMPPTPANTPYPDPPSSPEIHNSPVGGPMGSKVLWPSGSIPKRVKKLSWEDELSTKGDCTSLVACSTLDAAESLESEGRSLLVLQGSAVMAVTHELVEGIPVVVLRGLAGDVGKTRDWSTKGGKTVLTVLLGVAGIMREESSGEVGTVVVGVVFSTVVIGVGSSTSGGDSVQYCGGGGGRGGVQTSLTLRVLWVVALYRLGDGRNYSYSVVI